jgi:hypothetical protein
VLCAVHKHPPGAETPIDTSPPSAAASTDDGETLNRQGAGSCAISIFCCSTATLPRRLEPFGLGWTEKVMLAGPCPCALAREIHGDSDRAVHAHSRSTVIVNVPLPPPAGICELPPLTETPQRSMDEGAMLVVDDEPPQPLTAKKSPAVASADAASDGREGRGAISVPECARVECKSRDRLRGSNSCEEALIA